MSRTALAIFLTAFLVLAVGCDGGDSAGSASGPKTPRYAIILDRSTGMQDDQGRACDALEAILEGVINDRDRNRLARATVFLTGTQKNVSTSVLGTIKFKDLIARGGLEASQSGQADAANRRKQVVADMVAKCRSEVEEVNYSPLYFALKSVARDLQQQCSPKDPCKIYYYSDLQEIAEPWICTEIFGGQWYGRSDGCPANRGRKAPKKSSGDGGTTELEWSSDAIPEPVDASRVEITVCGVDQSRDSNSAKIGPGVSERRDKVWRGLFGSAKEFQVLGSCDFL